MGFYLFDSVPTWTFANAFPWYTNVWHTVAWNHGAISEKTYFRINCVLTGPSQCQHLSLLLQDVLISQCSLNAYFKFLFILWGIFLFSFLIIHCYAFFVSFAENILNPQYEHQLLPKWLYFSFWDALTALAGRATENIASYAFWVRVNFLTCGSVKP